MKSIRLTTTLLLTAGLLSHGLAEERTMTAEQMEKLAKGEELIEVEVRPAKLPDLTKGEPMPPSKDKPQVWNLGPTGVAAIMVGQFAGDQLLVQGAIKGSPADGKVLPGDVITGLNGRKFQHGGHLGITIGDAIIEAEREINGGKIVLNVWRDRNYVKRHGKQDVASVDVDQLFQAARDDNTLYDWKPEEERTEEVRQAGFDKYPLDPVTLDIELKIRTFPDYGDGLLEDCPKTRAILEDAWKVLEKKFVEVPGNRRSGRGGVIEAMALLASGKPEHKKLVHDWVRSKHSPWRPPTVPAGAMFEPDYRGYKGMQSWHHGFNGLYCALYYEATGDDFVLPALRKYALDAAMGQSMLGSWGHTFAYPSFNGGEFNRMNPGYGALNAAGNRCFYLITLAQKLGIKDPRLDQAVERARVFFSSYIDQGCIPYGDHGAYGSDDSNGKNTGVAFSLKLLGDEYGARYFAMMSTHCAFTRRGGHGHDYHGNWSSWASNLSGPQVRAYQERNLRWRRTLCRMYDGSFVYHSPTGKYGALRDPTATEVMHQSSIFKQLLITGKDVPESWHLNEREMKQMLASARGQLTDPKLLEIAGPPVQERPTAEVLDLLDIFFPRARQNFAKELGKRHLAGDKEVLPGALKLLESDNARFRDGALLTLMACGNDAILSNLSKIIPLLSDKADFVQITASKAVAKGGENKEAQLAMLDATLEPFEAIEPNSLGNTTQGLLFGGNTKLATRPFDAGFDPDKVQRVLEKLILLDPAGKTFLSSRAGVWDKDTVLRLAGPLLYAAEQEQIGDQMFANRSDPARRILAPLGHHETLLSSAYRLRQKAEILPDYRANSSFKRSLCKPEEIKKNPAAFAELLPAMETVLVDNPVESITVKDRSTNYLPVSTPLRLLHPILAKAADKPAKLPLIETEVARMLDAELKGIQGAGAQIKHCSQILADPSRRDIFRKLVAMDRLAEMLGPDVIEELVPYLNHDYFRLRDRSRQLTANAIKSGGASLLTQHFDPENYPSVAAAILATYALSGDAKGADLAKQALAQGSGERAWLAMRYQALHTLAILKGSEAIDPVLAHLKSAESKLDQIGCEEALARIASNSQHTAAVRDRLIKELPKLEIPDKGSAYMVLARISDDKCLELLEKAGKTDSKTEFALLVKALSYSPSRRADQILLDFARTDKASAEVVGNHAVRRLVLGPKGVGDLTDKERMDFVEPLIQLSMNKDLITYLSTIYDARALRTLNYCLENGVAGAVESLVSNAERAPQYSSEDSKVAAEAIRNVIEYIEVTYLRGGPEGKDFRVYPKWKAMQARAGKALLKVHKPEKEAIPTFDPLEFE